MNDSLDAVRLPVSDAPIAPVTILDAQGHVVRVVAADTFRRIHQTVTTSRDPAAPIGRGRRGNGQTS
jgi:hypothetical protein